MRKSRSTQGPDLDSLLDLAEDRASSEDFQHSRYQPFVEARDKLTEANQNQQAERMHWAAEAFMFGERRERLATEPYFGSLFTFTDGSAFPDWDAVTEEKLDLYEHRARMARSPIVSSRYADIVWEKRKNHQFARSALVGYVRAAEIYHGRDWGVQLVNALRRATEIAVQLRDRALVQGCVWLLISWLDRLEGRADYRWGLEIVAELLRMPVRYVSSESLVRSQKFALRAAEHFHSLGGDSLFLQRDFLDLARKAGTRLRDQEGAREISLMIARSFEESGKYREADSHIVASHFYGDALQVFRRAGEREKVEELLLKIRECNLAGQAEFGTISTEVTVPTEKVELLLDHYTSATLQENLQRISVSFRPNLSFIRESVSRLKKEAPLQFLIGRRTFAGDGRVVGEVSGEDQLVQQHVTHHVRFGCRINGMFLAEVMRKLTSERGLSATSLAGYLCSSQVVGGNRKDFLEAALERYFAGDHVSCIHVLVPQIEHILRSILPRIGLPDTYIDDQGITRVKPLDRVLQTPAIKEALGEDLWMYFYTFLVDQDADNVRNDVAHGLIAWEACNEVTATVLIHLLLTVTIFEFRQSEPSKSPTAE